MGEKRKLAIVLFNLGGPDSPEAVRPFLLNLFSDRAILRVPPFVRFFLARLITKRRLPFAIENYALLGGSSPLLKHTQEQADDLRTALAERLPDHDVRSFIAMRYWNPRAAETVRQVKDFAPDQVFLLPLYPQFSTTTTGSSLAEWRDEAIRAGLVAPFKGFCCWYDDPRVNAALATLVREAYDKAVASLPAGQTLRILFSAHGLPQAIVDAGDPYQFQIETMSRRIVEQLAILGLDWRICYQSRATPQQWLEPSTDHEVEKAGEEGIALLVVPIAFVSDHSETLVELDIEYRQLAEKSGVPAYFCSPAPNNQQIFIQVLADIVYEGLQQGSGLCPARGITCPKAHTDCPKN